MFFAYWAGSVFFNALNANAFDICQTKLGALYGFLEIPARIPFKAVHLITLDEESTSYVSECLIEIAIRIATGIVVKSLLNKANYPITTSQVVKLNCVALVDEMLVKYFVQSK